MGLLCFGKIGLSSLLTAIVLSFAFYQIHLNYISIYLLSIHLLSSDVGVGGKEMAFIRAFVYSCVRHKVCVRNSS